MWDLWAVGLFNIQENGDAVLTHRVRHHAAFVHQLVTAIFIGATRGGRFADQVGT